MCERIIIIQKKETGEDEKMCYWACYREMEETFYMQVNDKNNFGKNEESNKYR